MIKDGNIITKHIVLLLSAVNGVRLARKDATIEYRFILKNGAVEIPSGSSATFTFNTSITPQPAITCTGITINTTGVLTAAFAAYATAECTFTRTVAANSNLPALTVAASVTPSVATFPTSGAYPVVPVHSGNPTLQVTNAVTSTNAADYVDGEWSGCCQLMHICLICDGNSCCDSRQRKQAITFTCCNAALFQLRINI